MQSQKTVLLADDDQAFLRLLTQQCQGLGIEVQTATDGLEALMLATRNVPDLLIVDIQMPGADGLSLCEKLGQDQQTRSIPIMVLTGKSDEETISRCKSMGARYVYKGLDVWEALRPTMCDILGVETETGGRPKADEAECPDPPAASSPPKILVIDDDPQITEAMSIRLGALGIDVTKSSNAKLGKLLAVTEKPDVIITDFHMPGISGEGLLINLQKDPETRNIPVIILTGDRVEGRENHALKRELLGRRGAAAYICKPLDFKTLLKELARHISLPAGPVR